MASGYLALRYVAQRPEARRDSAIDAGGAALVTVALGLLTWPLTEAAGARRAPGLLWSAASAGAVLFAAFVVREHRLKERALMPPALLRGRSFIGLNLLTFFLYGSLGGLIVLLPYLLIRIEHWSALSAGASLLPVPVVIGVSSRFTGRWTARVGGRLPLTLGCALVGIGLALYARVGSASIDYVGEVLAPTLLVALGMGACVAPLTTSIIVAADRDHVGIASGFNSAVARIAGLVATAALGFVFARQDSAQGFLASFRAAALIGAASAALAAVCAAVLIPSRPGSPAG